MPRNPRHPAHAIYPPEDPRRTLVGIWGKNEGELARHNIVLAAFLEQLLKDERVLALFHKWSEILGGVRASYHCPITFDPPPKAQEAERELDGLISKQTFEPCNLFIGFLTFLRPHFIKEIIDLVRDELGLPWPIIGLELLQAFIWTQIISMLGATPRLYVWYESLDLPVPTNVILNFRPNLDETLGSAEQRFENEVEKVRAIFRAAKASIKLPQGKIPTDMQRELTGGIGKYARWLYQHYIRKQSQRSIAKAYHEDHHPGPLTDSCGCLRLVRHGIKEAERLLNLPTTPPI